MTGEPANTHVGKNGIEHFGGMPVHSYRSWGESADPDPNDWKQKINALPR